MSDQERQIPPYFKGNYRNMTLELQLNDANDNLLVLISNQDTLDCFELKVDSKYIQEKPDLSFMFQNPKQMKLYLVNNFSEVILTRDGELRFEVKIGAAKSKLLTISIPNKLVEKQGLLNVKIEKVKQSVEEDIKNLKENFEANLHKIREQMRLQMKRKDEQLNRLIQTVDELKRQNKQHEDYILTLFPGHPQGKHTYAFYTKMSTQHSIIVQPRLQGHANFVLRNQIIPGSQAEFDCKVLDFQSSAELGLGFHSQYILTDSVVLDESVQYWCNGHLQIGNQVIKSKPKINKNDHLSCLIDRVENTFTWFINDGAIHKESIPIKIRNKRLFFVVSFKNKQDQVQIFF